ncbi:MAG: MotA/TolQ/ExbB proton channel family protein [Myxococcales bacterium]|nr:MotA/TolQ/ExbB proton channel family protein [Myxococcales bacterium]
MKHSLWEILDMAGGAMWVILAFSVIVLAVALDRAIAHWGYMRKARALHENVTRGLSRGAFSEARSACERSQSPLADVFLVGFERNGRTKSANVASAVQRERVRVLAELKSRTWLLGTIGATAPFVGLFGTVVGIIEGLGSIFEEKKNDLAIVAGPLSEALYATAAGILVAVEAVIVFNYFNQRLAKVALEIKLLAEEFIELLEEAEEEKPPAKSKGKSGKKFKRADSDDDDDDDDSDDEDDR